MSQAPMCRPLVGEPPWRKLAISCCLTCWLLSAAGSLIAQPAEEQQSFAVRPMDSMDPGGPGDDVASRVRAGRFQRWLAGPREEFRLEVGPEAKGQVVILADVLPLDPAVGEALRGLPVQFEGAAVVFAGTRYDDPRQTVALRLPGTTSPNTTSSGTTSSGTTSPGTTPPTWVVVGHSPQATAEMADSLLFQVANLPFRWRREQRTFDYLLRKHRWAERSGTWQISGQISEAGISIDPHETNDFAARDAFEAGLAQRTAGAVRWRLPTELGDEPVVVELRRGLAAWVEVAESRVPVPHGSPLEVVVEPDYLTQGRHLGAIGEAVVDGERAHLVLHPDDTWAYRQALARILIRRAGLVLPPWIEDGAALWLAGDWLGRPYTEWAHDLAQLDTLPTATELLAPERQPDSSAVLWPPVAAAVIDRLPGETLRQKLERLPSAQTLDTLLRAQATRRPGQPTERPPTKTRATLPGFVRGVSLAMANGIEVGYHAPGIDDQLLRLRRLGADGVSIMPFAYQADPHRPGLSFLNRSPESETDIGAVHAARRAREAGFTVLWKPHIWLSHDSWPGDVQMTNEADWQSWWRGYRRYILHHAVLARHAGAEIFSIGVELGQTMEREQEWRSLIAAVRRVYPGLLTYAGNWYGDYDRAPFWDALDYVGVDAYFPLSADTIAHRPALQAGARRAVEELRQAAERFGRPVLLTEFGFAARRGAWVEPHQEGGELDLADQALAYEVFLEALGDPPWLAGAYTWKTFSHQNAEGGERPDFRFLGRPAEKPVADWFGRITAR